MSTAPNVQYVTVPELNGKRLPILSPPGDGSMNPSQITDAEYAVLERRGTAVSKIGRDLMNYHRAWKRAVSDGSGGDSGGGGILSSILGQAGSLFGGKKQEQGAVQTYETPASPGMSPVLIVGALAAAGGLAWWAFAKPAPKRAANGRRRRRGRRTGR